MEEEPMAKGQQRSNKEKKKPKQSKKPGGPAVPFGAGKGTPVPGGK
jgi:hypothetical protein